MLGDKIRELRTMRNINQQELADAIGVSKSSVAMWEIDKREPTLSKISELSSYFGVPSDFLLGTGVFKNWDKIKKNKDGIVELLEKTFKKPELIEYFNNYWIFIIFLNTSVSRIEFHDDGDFDIYFYPLYEDNNNIKNNAYINGDNNGIQAVSRDSSNITVNGTAAPSEKKDTLTEQFMQKFEQLDFDDKVDVMQYVKNKK